MIDTRQQEEIRALSRGVKNASDLADVLQRVYDFRYPKAKPRVELRAKDLNYYAFICKDRYHQFSITKKSGGERVISAPTYKLKIIQRCLSDLMQCWFIPSHVVTGFVPGKSVVDNAGRHVGRSWVYNIDIKDFFPSIEFRRVKTMLGLPPFNFPDEVAFLIANICCDENCLPQGAPTSPVLTNVICQRLDRRLTKLSKSHRVTYSRYADDLTFSSFKDVPDRKMISAIAEIVASEGFELNEAKERLVDRTKSLRVTGLVVNEKVNVSKAFKKDIRYWLRTWKRFGTEKTQADFERRTGNKTNFTHSLLGKIRYFGMVRGRDDSLYEKYLVEFGANAQLSRASDNRILLEETLEVWKKFGLKSALENYFNSAQHHEKD